MTTIVGDWARKILVADSQYSDDDAGIKYFEDKVFAIPNGWLGGAGTAIDIEKVLAHIKNKGKTPPKLKGNSCFLMLTDAGLFSCGDDLEWETVRTNMAIGSGAMAAETVMRMGHKAEEAVRWACNVDLMSHEPIKVYTLGTSQGKLWTGEKDE